MRNTVGFPFVQITGAASGPSQAPGPDNCPHTEIQHLMQSMGTLREKQSMAPPNIRAKTNQREATEGDSLHSLSSTGGFQPLCLPSKCNQTSKPRAYPLLRPRPAIPTERGIPRPEPEAHRLVHSYITSFEQVSLWVEVTRKILLTLAFMATLDEVLDRSK